MKVSAFAAKGPHEQLESFSYEMGAIGPEQVDVKVLNCGICHSDLSMMNNDWGMTTYPIVPGHEVIGEVLAAGNAVKNIKVGDKVGVGWFSGSCMSCHECMDGSHHLCSKAEYTIGGRHGGFADHIRSNWSWAIPLPEGINLEKAGPLLCGGITVFNPIILAGVKATDKVGVIGIGGLGHMALKFLNKWGCEVIAFSSSPEKKESILAMGATKVVDSTKPEELEKIAGTLNFILNTTNVTLDWNSYLVALAPKGKFHNVGAVLEPMAIRAFTLVTGEKSVAGSPLGSPALTRTMLEFCVRHDIYPITEEFPMERVNEAIEHLKSGKARYRIVLKNEKQKKMETNRNQFATTLILLLVSLITLGQEAKAPQKIDYKSGDPAEWPAHLDAVKAAPDNHKILLENDEVRVLQVSLAPGEKEPLHHHKWPSVLYIQEAGDFIDYDKDGQVIFDTRKLPEPLSFPLTMQKEPEAPHSVVNLSKTTPVRLIRVEIKPENTNQNAAIIDGLYQAFSAGDIPAVLGAMDDNIVWNEAESNPYADGNPYIGPEAVLNGLFARVGADYEYFKLEDIQLHEMSNNKILATLRYNAKVKETGKTFNAQVAHLWTLNKEGKITAFQQYVDTKKLNDAMSK